MVEAMSSVCTRVLILAVVMIGFLTVAFVVTRRRQMKPVPTPELTAAEFRDLARKAQLAIGNLENREFSQADELLNQLLVQLPTEPMAVRNLAISRLLSYAAGVAALGPLESALQRLQQVDPDSEVTHWLMGRMRAKLQESIRDPTQQAEATKQALDAFAEALQRAPEQASFWWDIFETGRYARDPALAQRAKHALAQVYRLAPNNFFVLTEWLVAQAHEQDRAVVDTLNHLKHLIPPVATGIQQRAHVNVVQLIDQALEATEAGNWPLVLGRSRQLMSLIRSEEISRSDHRRIELDALEFVLHDFQGAVAREFKPPPVEPGLGPQIDWIPAKADPQLSQLDDVRDVAAADFDLDGVLDLIVLRPKSVEVYSRSESAAAWELMVKAPLANQPRGLLVADLDRDTFERKRSTGPSCFEADSEVVVFGASGIVILENRLRSEEDVRELLPVEQPGKLAELQEVTTATLVDFDHDGDLDLVCATASGLALWSNRDNLTFEDATSWSMLPPAAMAIEWLVAVDWDRDVDTDILLGGRSLKPGYLENIRHGQLRWRSLDTAFSELDFATHLAVGEVDRNASWDLLAARSEGLAVARTTTMSPGVTRHLASELISASGGQSLATLDYDNDGWQDVVLFGETGLSLFHGGPEGEFAAAGRLMEDRSAQVCRPADLDADGDLDLVVLASGRLSLLTNEGGNRNHWMRLLVRGEAEEKSGRVNHNGLGSTIELKSGGAYQAQVVSTASTHFGLGRQVRADVVRVLFTNGIPQAVIQPEADQVICEKMMLKGSCPYVYTWNGARFEFQTDLLWAAPLGLQLADGVIAPDRPSEYLKIDGSRLRPNDDYYLLQVTEELWEAAYFDRIELIAIDHPAAVEIFSNEKVGPASIAEFKLHTVRRRRSPVTARDKQGRDVLDVIRTRDGRYLRAFDTTFRQGLAEQHYLELDLGQLEKPKQITLFLTGWILPTDTSLNVALSHNPELTPPRPPAVWVPNAAGEWQEAIPYMGFPGGKTKTIAVDLSGVFPTDDYRLRIVTSAELYWDEAFFTVDEEPAPLRQSSLKLAGADLHYRGFSRPQPALHNGPDTYDYQQVIREQRWPPMNGRFTAYGDVQELLTETDDMHVVLASGDELTLRFDLPLAPPPSGWTRDFILHNVGWDKDADLNTVYGQTVEPLPFVGMSSYPFALGQDYPDTPRHQRYRQRYQTRFVRAAPFWKQILRYQSEQ